MFKFPELFTSENENNLTLPPMKSFAAKYELSLKDCTERKEIISRIEDYANSSAEKLEAVQCWFDTVATEGIKELHVRFADLKEEDINRLKNRQYVSSILDACLFNPANRHFIGNTFSEEISLVNYTISNSPYGEVIDLSFCEILDIYDHITGNHTEAMMYPIRIQFYIDSGILVARAKSKANLCQHISGEVTLDKVHKTNVEVELNKVFSIVSHNLDIGIQPKFTANKAFRNRLFFLLEAFTTTPDEIKENMSEKDAEIQAVVETIQNQICAIPDRYKKDIHTDVSNMIEKYLSITRTDKSIFMNNKAAYPLKISATDEENSKVEQTSALEEPLQSKAVFFDNRRMMQKSQLCDGVWFMFQRINSRYYSKYFKVKILIKNNTAILRFTEYTAEEDLQNVLFSFINAGAEI